MKIKTQINAAVSALILWSFSSGNVLAATDTWFANGDGTVTDVATGLVWQQLDDDVTRNHANATTYCQSLTLANTSNWRLPNAKELASIVDYRANRPAIDAAEFPDTDVRYWSVTNNPNSSNSAWYVFFESGAVQSDIKDELFFVRCVR